MRFSTGIVVLLGLGSLAQAGDPTAAPTGATASPPIGIDAPAPAWALSDVGTTTGRLAGTHQFPGFIGFMSNPLQNIDPRAVTELYPLFGSAWTKEAEPVPSSDFQLYGAGLTIALSDRFAVGMNQGGYADVHLSRKFGGLVAALNGIGRDKIRALVQSDPRAAIELLRSKGVDVRDLADLRRLLIADPTGQFSGVSSGGDRSGWLNLGGFAQYTLIQDVPNQFLTTVGMRVVAPCGSHDIFQGHGPAHLAPYVTVGKEWGDTHFLGTVGYVFPAGPGDDTTQLFYLDVHLDRRLFGWLYPLVEFNYDYHVTGVSIDQPARRGFFEMNNFEAAGNILTMAVGANAVLIPEKLEFGAVYSTSLATQRDFNVNGLIVKLVYRY